VSGDYQQAANVSDPPAFIADAMLGALARWVRAVGYDCHWQEGIDDAELIELAIRDRRVILTCDTGVMKRGIIATGQLAAVYLRPDVSRYEQLRQVLSAMGLGRRYPPRCMKCGGRLIDLPAEAAQRVIPPKALRHHDEFYQCARCGKLYWPGTHWKKIEARLAAMEL